MSKRILSALLSLALVVTLFAGLGVSFAAKTQVDNTDEIVSTLEKGAIITHKTGKKASHSGNAYYYNAKNRKCSAKWTKLTQAVLEKSNSCLGVDGKVTAYYLTGDLDLEQEIIIEGTVHICLNGKTVDAQENGSAFYIYEGATLYLYDCTGKGCICNGTGHDRDDSGVCYGGAVYNEGNFVMYGGCLCDCEAEYGGAVCNDGVFLMEGGSIEDCCAEYYGGAVENIGYYKNVPAYFIMNGGTIENCCAENDVTYTCGGAVYNYADNSNAYFTLNGGTIADCWAMYGGGVYNDEDNYYAFFTMNGGTIESCSALYNETDLYGSSGGAVYNAYGTFTLNAGMIADCEAYWGSCVYNWDEFIMNGGSIKDCYAEYNEDLNYGGYGGYGGGVYNRYKFTLNAGTISGCAADWYGGGVCNYVKDDGDSWDITQFTMNGGVIADCEACYGGGVFNWYDADNVEPNAEKGAVYLNGGKIRNCSAVEYVYDNGSWNYSYGGGVYNCNGLVETKSATITGCTADYGGGVYNYDGTIAMISSDIINCTAEYYGGGVSNYAYKNDLDFTMDGSSIKNCTAAYGGGIVNDGRGNFKMNRSTITECTATVYGGGMYAKSYQGSGVGNDTLISESAEKILPSVQNILLNVVMSDSSITNCSAAVSGGGIYAWYLKQMISRSSYGVMFYLTGVDLICGNTVQGRSNNVYRQGAYGATMMLELQSGSRIGITPDNSGFAQSSGDNNYSAYLTSDNPNFSISVSNPATRLYSLTKRSDTAFDSLTIAPSAGWQTLIFADEAGNLSDKSLDVYMTQNGSNWNYQTSEDGLYLNIANGKLVKSAKCNVTWIYANGTLSAQYQGVTYYLAMGENGPELSRTKVACGILYSHVYGATKVIK